MSEGQNYVVTMSDTTIVANATLVILRAAAALSTRGSRLQILRCEVSQNVSSTPQQLGIVLGTKVSAFGTYTSATPAPLEFGGAASGIAGGTAGAAATAGVDASAEGAGAVTTVKAFGFNNIAGFLYVPVPEERMIISPDIAFVMKLVGTPTTLTNWNAIVVFRELN